MYRVWASGSAAALIALAALAVSAAPKRAGPAERQVSISAQPTYRILKGDQPATVQLRIEVREGKALASAADVVLQTTAGTVSGLHVESPGVFTAELLRPAEAFPQLAVVTAVEVTPTLEGRPPWIGQTVVAFWAAIDLKGRVEPGATMRVKIGNTFFGPTEAGSDGRFVLPVEVRPGEGWALGIATDKLGNASRSSINLYLPAVERMHGAVYPRAVIAGEENDPAWVFVTTVDTSGAPQDLRTKVRVGRGKLGASQRLARGLQRITYTPPVELGDGRDVVIVEAKGAKAELPITLLAGAPTELSVVVAPPLVAADGESETFIDVGLRDARGNPADGHLVTVGVGSEDPAVATAAGPGAYRRVLPGSTRVRSEEIEVVVTPQAPSCYRPRRISSDLVVDLRGIECAGFTGKAQLIGDQTVVIPLQARAKVAWRLPTPIDLRIAVMERTAGLLRFKVTGGGDADLAKRIELVTTAGTPKVESSEPGALVASVKLKGAAGPIDIVARDGETGISAWVRAE